MRRQRLLKRLGVSMIVFAILILLWQLVRGPNSGLSNAEAIAASLLQDSNQPLQIGAQLSPEAVSLGNFVTLTVVIRNNDAVDYEPRVAVQLPHSLRLDAVEEDPSTLLNAAEQTLYWYPRVGANGGIVLETFNFLALEPTGGEQDDMIGVQFYYGEVVEQLNLPFWSGAALEPAAEFAVVDDYVGLGQQLIFTNRSAGRPPMNYHWDFGDGRTANDNSPYHSYDRAGRYVVTLTASNPLGESTFSLPIEVGSAPNTRILVEENVYAGSPFIAQAFSDGSQTTLLWDMGDGTELTGFWVEHTYAVPGEYLVTLNVNNLFGNTILSEIVVVQPGSLQPVTEPAITTPVAIAAAANPIPTTDVLALDIQLKADSAIDSLPLTDQLLGYINKARLLAGLQPLAWSYELSLAAQSHTDEAAFGYITGHIGTDGSTPFDRVRRFNYVEGFLIGETTAWGFNSAMSAVQFWLDSPDHKPLILNQEADQAGVGHATNYDSNFAWYWAAEIASFEVPEAGIIPGGSVPVPTRTPSPTASMTASASPSASPTSTETVTATPTGLPTNTIAPTGTAETETPTTTPTPTSTPTETATSTGTATSTVTATPEETPTLTPTSTFTPTPTTQPRNEANDPMGKPLQPFYLIYLLVLAGLQFVWAKK